jgi:hypothetical protein
MALNPGMNLAVMGNTSFPTANADGSGDKAPTLLPLAMQVAAQTIGLDLVPVVPMAGPMGLLSYLDFVYEGGTLGGGAPNFADGTVHPTYIRTALAVSAGDTVVGTSRIDGLNLIELGADTLAAGLVTATYADAELVKALEDHIPGFSGGADNADGVMSPMSRGLGESTRDKVMGLSLFSKSVAAETFQVAAAVTREQVQDLKQFGVDAVAQVEAVLTNELTQSINNHILRSMRRIAGENLFGAGVDMNIAPVAGETRGDSHRRILTAILAAGNLIAQRGRRGAGNFAVVGGSVASALQGVSGFVAYPMANTINQVAGAIYPLGSIAGINVYTDPSVAFASAEILVGRKGDGNGPGLVFMPYLMAESVQTIVEGTMAPKVAVKSRYALVEAGFHPGTQYETFSIGLANGVTSIL